MPNKKLIKQLRECTNDYKIVAFGLNRMHPLTIQDIDDEEFDIYCNSIIKIIKEINA